jgi:hypothetical protein
VNGRRGLIGASLLLLVASAAAAGARPLDDQAEVLSSEDRAALGGELEQLRQRTGVEMAVIVLPRGAASRPLDREWLDGGRRVLLVLPLTGSPDLVLGRGLVDVIGQEALETAGYEANTQFMVPEGLDAAAADRLRTVRATRAAIDRVSRLVSKLRPGRPIPLHYRVRACFFRLGVYHLPWWLAGLLLGPLPLLVGRAARRRRLRNSRVATWSAVSLGWAGAMLATVLLARSAIGPCLLVFGGAQGGLLAVTWCKKPRPSLWALPFGVLLLTIVPVPPVLLSASGDIERQLPLLAISFGFLVPAVGLVLGVLTE